MTAPQPSLMQRAADHLVQRAGHCPAAWRPLEWGIVEIYRFRLAEARQRLQQIGQPRNRAERRIVRRCHACLDEALRELERVTPATPLEIAGLSHQRAAECLAAANAYLRAVELFRAV